MSEREVFTAALRTADRAVRAGYLDKACAGKAALRRRVDALLAAHERGGDLLGRTAIEISPPELDRLVDAADATIALASASLGAGDNTAVGDTDDASTGDDDQTLNTLLAPAAQPGALGRLAGHYDVRSVLGRGAFGIVLKAFDEKLQRLVAIKVLGAQLADNATARKRFLREARAAAAISSEFVVGVYAVDEEPAPYLVMEYVSGHTLQDKLERGPIALKDVLRIGQQIADGLAAAHAIGLIHRDIKPANILLEEGGERVKITDFGLARAADDATLTQSGVISGTPMYMAPEQAQDDPIDHRADLFSLGSVLYVMCTGQPPFRASTTLAVLKRVCEEQPKPIHEVNPAIPMWLCDIIGRLHAKKPADRFASARDVADLLGRCLMEMRQQGGVRSSIRPPTAQKRAPATAIKPVASPSKPRQPSRRWLIAGGGALLLVIVFSAAEATGITNVLGTRSGQPERPSVVENVDSNAGKASPPSAVEKPSPADSVAAWERKVAALSAVEQVQAVAARLKECNPEFDGVVTPTIEAGVLTGLKFKTDRVTDISPLRVLARLKSLEMRGTFPARGSLADLAALKGMPLSVLLVSDNKISSLTPLAGMPLTKLHASQNPISDLAPLADMPLKELNITGTQVRDLKGLEGFELTSLYCEALPISDLAPLRGMKLTELGLYVTHVSDLSPLAGMPLLYLNVAMTKVSDLSPIKGMPLVALVFEGTPVTDLSPLRELPLKHVRCHFRPERDAAILRAIKSLETINGMPAAQVLKTADGKP
jgi:serine/threonine protein kinase